MLYSQQWAETDYTDESTFHNPESSFYPFYTGALKDLAEIIRLNSDEETIPTVVGSGMTNNQIAIAKILRSWLFMNVTDIWGDVPYTEALKGEENLLRPIYDSQKEIYSDLIVELIEARDMIVDEGDFPIKGDIIYDGDMTKWKKFSNSILLRIGLRLSEVEPEKGSELVLNSLESGVFDGPEDNAVYKHLDDDSNANRHYLNFLRRNDYGISSTMVSFMQAGTMSDVHDPRIEVYANPAENPEAGKKDSRIPFIENYGGMPYGLTTEDASALSNTYSSYPGDAVRSRTTPTIFMSFSEVLFLKAEAMELNWILGDPIETMKEGVIANMEYWGIEESRYSTYVENINILSGDVSETILTQKWIALYTQGLTAWSSWRRTGSPKIEPGPFTQDTDEIPRRRAYDSDEYTLNTDNIKRVIDSQGPDSFETRVWWDKD